jgi:hypothetical protein
MLTESFWKGSIYKMTATAMPRKSCSTLLELECFVIELVVHTTLTLPSFLDSYLHAAIVTTYIICVISIHTN